MGVKTLLWLAVLISAPCHISPPSVSAQGTKSFDEASTPSASLFPPQPLLEWNHSAQDIVPAVQDILEEYTKALDKIAGLDSEACTFESVFLAIEELDTHLSSTLGPLAFYQNMSPNKELRDAATEADLLMQKSSAEASMRVDIFNAQVSAERNIKASGHWARLLPEEQRLIEQSILNAKRAGLMLPEEKRTELEGLQTKLDQVTGAYIHNMAEDQQVISLTEEDLKGVPHAVLLSYTKRKLDDGKVVYDIALKDSDTVPIHEYADRENTRELVFETAKSRLTDNIGLLDKAVELRRNIAKLLGHKTWADYVTETQMAKSPENVQRFLDDVEAKLLTLGLEEKDALLELKRQDYEGHGPNSEGELYIWDLGYYDTKYKEKFLNLDNTLVKEYFAVDVTVRAILDIYSRIFSLLIEEVKEASAWHPEVQTFAVWEKDAKDCSDFLGYFYLDLFPRDGKNTYTASMTILSSYQKPDGGRQYPVSVLTTNFARAGPGDPILLSHSDVMTFFHEMGHVFHDVLSRTMFATFHGTNAVDGDFLEAPSQMLENWIWEPTILEKISSHYVTHEPLPPQLIAKLVESRYVNIGLVDLVQIFYAKFDLQIHSEQEPQDHTKLYNILRKETTLLSYKRETPGQSDFSHIMEGYAALYYGYMYSLVFAADMYSTVFKPDPLSPVSGQLYRDKVLLPGGSRDASDILKDFLGREPNSQAFLEQFAKPRKV